jgi:hypothetical protein
MLGWIENQSRLKMVIRDNRSGDTEGFWEFDNTFAMGELPAFSIDPTGDGLIHTLRLLPSPSARSK